jgi:hypothetical protein
VLCGGLPQFHSRKRQGILFPAATSGPSILLSNMYCEILSLGLSGIGVKLIPLNAEVKNDGAISPLTYNVFMACCVINQAKEDQQRTKKFNLRGSPNHSLHVTYSLEDSFCEEF